MKKRLQAMAGFDALHVVNVILTGVIAVFGFHGSLHAIGVSGGRPDSESDQSLIMK